MIKTIIIAIICFIAGVIGTILGITFLFIQEIDGNRIPFLDAYYERKQIKENKKYNERILQSHRDYFGEEPVIKWK